VVGLGYLILHLEMPRGLKLFALLDDDIEMISFVLTLVGC
jgi:hypothetical protein